MGKIASDSMSKKEGNTTAEGSYSIIKTGINVLIAQISFSVKKTDMAGIGQGVMGFALFDGNGERIFNFNKAFTVGIDLLDALAEKTFEESFTILGPKWNEVAGVAFTVDATSAAIKIPTSPDDWKDLLGEAIPDILGGLGIGETKEVAGWLLKKLK